MRVYVVVLMLLVLLAPTVHALSFNKVDTIYPVLVDEKVDEKSFVCYVKTVKRLYVADFTVKWSNTTVIISPKNPNVKPGSWEALGTALLLKEDGSIKYSDVVVVVQSGGNGYSADLRYVFTVEEVTGYCPKTGVKKSGKVIVGMYVNGRLIESEVIAAGEDAVGYNPVVHIYKDSGGNVVVEKMQPEQLSAGFAAGVMVGTILGWQAGALAVVLVTVAIAGLLYFGRLRQYVPLLALPMLLLAVVAPVAGAEELKYVNSGEEMAPGYKVEVEMYAEAAKWLQGYSFSPAALKIGDIEVGFEADPPGWGGFGSIKVYWFVKDGGSYVDKVLVGEVGVNEKKQFDASIVVEWPCGSGSLKISATTPVGGKSYTLNPGTPPVDLLEYETSQGGLLSPDTQSDVTIGEVVKIGDCNADYGDFDPPSPDDPANIVKSWLDASSLGIALAGAALAVVMVLAAGGRR